MHSLLHCEREREKSGPTCYACVAQHKWKNNKYYTLALKYYIEFQWLLSHH